MAISYSKLLKSSSVAKKAKEYSENNKEKKFFKISSIIFSKKANIKFFFPGEYHKNIIIKKIETKLIKKSRDWEKNNREKKK